MYDAVNGKCRSIVPKRRNTQPRSPIGQGRARSLQHCAAIKRSLRLGNAKETKRQRHILPISYSSICPISFLLTCVSSYSWVSQGFIFPYWKTELLPEQCHSGHIPSYSAQCNLGSSLVNIFCQQPARKHKISADKICRCCRAQGVVNNDQNRTLIWVFSKIENM